MNDYEIDEINGIRFIDLMNDSNMNMRISEMTLTYVI